MSDTKSRKAIDRLDRSGAGYECSRCPSIVTSPEEDRAALVIEDAQYLLCAECGRELRDEIEAMRGAA